MNHFLKTKELFLDILFPKFCVNCQREGNYICQDCFALIDISDRQYCPFCISNEKYAASDNFKTCYFCKKTKNLDGLFCAASYQNPIIRKLISEFKYEPFVRDYSKILSQIIILHLALSHKIDFLKDFLITPVPLFFKKTKQRGFNQSEEIAKYLSWFLKIPVLKNTLVRVRNTFPQASLSKEKRGENIKKAFSCLTPEAVENKKILLVDDVFTTGSTIEECAFVLKNSRAKEVWGIVVAKG